MTEPSSPHGAKSPGDDGPNDESPDSTHPRKAWRLMMWALFLGAVVAGGFLQPQIADRLAGLVPEPNAGRKVLYWQSPMDTSVRSDKPGKTPMGMDLVPVYADDEPAKGPVVIPPEIQEREFATVAVEEGPLVRSLESVSTVTYAEPLIGDVTLKMEGWLEKLYVDYEGQRVKPGDPLFDVYAPALFAAEEEFLISLAYSKDPATAQTRDAAENVESARQKLLYLDMSDQQIEELASRGVVQKTVTYHSPYAGIVIKKQAFAGKSMPAGQLVYRIADLSKVWIDVFVYENQIHCVHKGQGATLTLPELPNRSFRGKVIYIYPYLEPISRTVKARLEFENPDLTLMPDMFGRVKLDPHRMGHGLSIPRTAVMYTGKRSLAYVALPGNRFESREIGTGMELDGDKLEVLDGLKAGERVVISPNFLLDSESRLRLVNQKFRAPTKPREGTSSHRAMNGMQGPMRHSDKHGKR